jgi:hypothetical protein
LFFMATLRTLGFFPQTELIKIFTPENQCLQPAGNFTIFNDSYSPPNLSFAPANVEYSQYIPLSFERAMAWFWKIKSWRVNINASFEFGSELSEVQTINESFLLENMDSIVSEPYSNEKEKICNPSKFAGSSFFYQDGIEPTSDGDWLITVQIGGSESVWVNYPNAPDIVITDASAPIRVDEVGYWMPVNISAVTVTGGGAGTGISYNGLINDSDAPSVWENSPNISWSLDDDIGSITKPFNFDFGTWLPSSTIDIVVEEYWDYD